MDLNEQRDLAEGLLAPHFPAGSIPFVLLVGVMQAISAAELRGYDDCLETMSESVDERMRKNANDNSG